MSGDPLNDGSPVHDPRRFPPSPGFSARANVTPEILAALPVDPVAFWQAQAVQQHGVPTAW